MDRNIGFKLNHTIHVVVDSVSSFPNASSSQSTFILKVIRLFKQRRPQTSS